MNKRELSERDICTKFITPALRRAGWDEQAQLREEVTFTDGRVIVRGRMVSRGRKKRADYILYLKPNIPLGVIEAKENACSVGDGIQQALEYARTLNIPFVFSSNGEGFVFHDRTVESGAIEMNLSLDEFPSPAALWSRYRVNGGGFRPTPMISSCTTTTATVAARDLVITRRAPSTPRPRRLPEDRTGCCS